MPRTDDGAQPDWRPGADVNTLNLRATLLARIRRFFVARDVLEVDTPLLSTAASTDPAIESFRSRYEGPGSAVGMPLFLHTSPEFFMKRLLAAGSGPIYQLCHVFRNGEAGRRHNPEFTMLEWYRPGFDQHALMDEIDDLLVAVFEGFPEYRPARRLSYRDWFVDGTGLDPWGDSIEAFAAFARDTLASVPDTMPDDELDPWLDLLVTHHLESRLGPGAVFVYDYPPSQASLAHVHHGEVPVAERFELYLNGIELANGFNELTNAGEQLQRFENDNHRRQANGQVPMPIDNRLVAAMRHGLPGCSGVAVGFDRLVMVAAGLDDIDAAMPFALQRI